MEIIIGLLIIISIFWLLAMFAIYLMSGATKKDPVSSMPKDPGFQIHIDRPTNHNETGRYQRLNGKPARWHGHGQQVSVQGYNIAAGFFVGETLLDSQGYENDACLINPKLKVLPAEPWEAEKQMGYWPKYAHIPEKCRGRTLNGWRGGYRT
jgi:hypothetical protein